MTETLLISEGGIDHFLLNANGGHMTFKEQKDPLKQVEDYLTSVLDQAKNTKLIIYLYRPANDKRETLLKVRNLLLPTHHLIPLPLPINQATQKSLLNALVTEFDKPTTFFYDKILEKWNAIIKNNKELTIFTKAKVLDRERLPDKYYLRIAKSGKVIKRMRGPWGEVMKVAKGAFHDVTSLEVVQKSFSSHLQTYKKLNDIQHSGDTLMLEMSGTEMDKER